MKNLKSTAFALLVLIGASFVISSCEEEIITPAREKLGTSGECEGMEDDGQFD